MLDTVDAVAEAIRRCGCAGAPLIGIAAAMGVALGRRAQRGRGREERSVPAVAALGATRPTAVNLRWALRRMERRAEPGRDRRRGRWRAALRAEAQAIWDEDRAMCERDRRRSARR